MEKVLITGGTGFIGKHLVERNLKVGNIVRVLATSDNPRAEELASRGIEIFYGDISNYRSVDNAVRGSDVVYHLAAHVTDWAPKKLFSQVNVEGTRNICEAAFKHKTGVLIYVSTCDVFGIRKDILIDESFDYQYWGEPYPDTKIDATNIVWEYHKKGLPVSVVYPIWVYGPGDRTFVPLIADAIRKGEMVFWKKNLKMYPTYVENLIDLLMVVSRHPKAIGEGFLIHDSEFDTLQNFCRKIASCIGAKIPSLQIPYWSAYCFAWLSEIVWKLLRKKTRPLLTTFTVRNFGSGLDYSIEKAKNVLGWVPPLSYEEGFKRTIEWLKETDPATWKQK